MDYAYFILYGAFAIMKFLLIFSFLFLAAFDACLASCDDESQASIHSTESCNLPDSADHETCRHCQTCQHVVIFQSLAFNLNSSVTCTEIPYQFYIPSADVESLKRPPKV